jgi:hypothetical protein
LNARTVVRMMAAGLGPETYYIAIDKGVRIHFNQRHGRVLMSIEINEHTRPKKIESHWKVISRFRGILHKAQGPWTGEGPGLLYKTLLTAKGTPITEWWDLLGMCLKEGTFEFIPPKNYKRKSPHPATDADLAKMLNFTLEQYLKDEVRERCRDGGTPGPSLLEAKRLLYHMRPRATDSDEICHEALESLPQGEQPLWARAYPCPYTGPITRADVRQRLITWKANMP